MVIRSALVAVALAALAQPALAQPTPAAPPAPPSLAAPPAPPAPPVPPVNLADARGYHFRGDHNEVITRNDAKGRIVIVARDGAGGWVWTGQSRPPQVLAYKDDGGRDVTVYADHAVTRAQVEAMRAEGRRAGERARQEGARARAEGERAREAGGMAREEGRRAREQAVVIRREALDDVHRAVAEAGAGRDYANLGRRELRVFRHDGREAPQVWVDGAPGPGFGPGFAAAPDMKALREELEALREEMKSLRAELDRERTRR